MIYLIMTSQKQYGDLVDREFDLVQAPTIEKASEHGQVMLMVPQEMIEGFRKQHEIAKKRRQG